ncbi:MAG TPA: tetratricopeptide repeat protein [Fimbriimonadaceae bacterium]|jgi:tetratricopeptide (TPR) repeat protein
MEPTRKDIADLFSVEIDSEPEIEESPRRTKGDNAEESVELGSQSLTEGDFEKAIEHFRRAVEQRDPNDVQGRVDLAGAYEFAEMAPEALRQYEIALRVRRDQPEPLLGLSQVYKRYARYKDSVRQLEEALALEPRNAFYQFKLAEILREIGDKEAALTAARMAVSLAPVDPFYHYWVGDLLIDLRQYDEALEALRAALELSPGDDYLYLRTASAFWGAGRQQEAVKAIRLASDLDPDKHLYHGILELLQTEMGLKEEASQEKERASKMDDYDREALRRFALEIGVQAE